MSPAAVNQLLAQAAALERAWRTWLRLKQADTPAPYSVSDLEEAFWAGWALAGTTP